MRGKGGSSAKRKAVEAPEDVETTYGVFVDNDNDEWAAQMPANELQIDMAPTNAYQEKNKSPKLAYILCSGLSRSNFRILK